jgi:predicted CXXCH cytochrome family protein
LRAVTAERTGICFLCHAKSQWTGRNPHRDAAIKQTGCTQCHAVNPEEDSESFVADITIVCLACHENPEHPGGIRHTVTLEPGMPDVPGSLPLGTGRRITCATCHDPHLESSAGHRLRGGKEPPAFCLRCHKL